MENKLTVIDENGTEIEMTILFTFESEEFGKQYVFYFDEQDESGEVYVASYTDDVQGGLTQVEDDAEWELITEVFETFNSHHEEHHHDHDHEHGCCCGHNH